MDKDLLNMIQSTASSPVVIQNPFSSKNISYISIWASPKLFSKQDGVWEFSATIAFKNGNTKGEQKIEGDNFSDLFTKLAAFCKSI